MSVLLDALQRRADPDGGVTDYAYLYSAEEPVRDSRRGDLVDIPLPIDPPKPTQDILMRPLVAQRGSRRVVLVVGLMALVAAAAGGWWVWQQLQQPPVGVAMRPAAAPPPPSAPPRELPAVSPSMPIPPASPPPQQVQAAAPPPADGAARVVVAPVPVAVQGALQAPATPAPVAFAPVQSAAPVPAVAPSGSAASAATPAAPSPFAVQPALPKATLPAAVSPAPPPVAAPAPTAAPRSLAEASAPPPPAPRPQRVAGASSPTRTKPTPSPVVETEPPAPPSLAADLETAWALLDRGEWAQAEAIYRNILASRRQPEPDAALGLAVALHRQKRWTEAWDAYRVSLRVWPDNPVAPTAMLSILTHTDAATAQSRLKAWVAERPQDAAAASAYGLLLGRKGQWTEAIAPLRRARELQPAHGAHAYNLAVALDQLGRFADAADQYRTAVSLGGTGVPVDAAKARLLELKPEVQP